MVPTFAVGWNEIARAVLTTDGDGPATLPTLPRHLDADLDAWEQHLADNFIPNWDGGLSAGDWTSDEARWWFVVEARRIERELRRAVPRSRAIITISAYPGVIPIGFYNDYGDWPLWSIGGGTGPDDFPMLSKDLVEDLHRWSDHHETGDARTEGHQDLLSRLRLELGPLYEVEWRDERPLPGC